MNKGNIKSEKKDTEELLKNIDKQLLLKLLDNLIIEQGIGEQTIKKQE